MIITPIDGISPAARAMTDAELMHDICAENGDALEALFCRYVRLVYRVAADILNDRAEAEDVTQEVFLEVYRKAYLYDPARGSVRVWLLQYAYHRTLRRKAALGRRAAYRGEPLDAADGVIQDDRQRLTREECRWVLRAGLAQLSERQRTTLELTCFEELTLRDVAERLGVSVGCTRHYYYRGLARLQEWARVTEGHTKDAHSRLPGAGPAIRGPWENGSRSASGADTAGGATHRDPSLCGRI
jgi:RNA polymerase sigma-70 factor (ECF subfamily)